MIIGPEKILVILFIALVVLGPEKLPDAARKAGRVLTEVRRISGGVSAGLEAAVTGALDGACDRQPARTDDATGSQQPAGAHQP